MAFDRKREIGARHAGAIVGDADKPPPTAIRDDLDASRACVERILGQLLHHARRPLHHLAGGDAVDDGFGELADWHLFFLTASRSTEREGRRFDWTLARQQGLGETTGATQFPANPVLALIGASL